VINAGEPYGAQAQAIANQIYTYHQGYGLPGTPAPLLLESGWTDDLFPPEQSLRVYNAARAAGGYAALQLGDLRAQPRLEQGQHRPGVQRPGGRLLRCRAQGSGHGAGLGGA
jgi:hypothetical protein